MKKALLTAVLLVALMTVAVSAQTYRAYVMQSEPLGYIDAQGNPAGEHYDYLVAIAERAGIDLEVEIVPKSRLFAAMRSGDIDMAIFFRSARWDDSVEYVSRIRQIRIVAVNRTGLPLNSYEDIHNSSRVGILADTKISQRFDEDSNINRHTCPDYETMLQLAAARRIATAVGNAIVLSYLVNKLGYGSAIQSEGITLGQKEQWLQFSSASSNQDIIPRLQAAVAELQADGTLDRILTSYAGASWRTLNQL